MSGAEFASLGADRLGLDERALDFLKSASLEVATQAVREFKECLASKDVGNRSSFFMGLLRQRQQGKTSKDFGAIAGTAGKGRAGDARPEAPGGRGGGGDRGSSGRGGKGGRGGASGGGRGGRAREPGAATSLPSRV